MILSAVWFFFLLIAGIVAAAYAPRFNHYLFKRTYELIAAIAVSTFIKYHHYFIIEKL